MTWQDKLVCVSKRDSGLQIERTQEASHPGQSSQNCRTAVFLQSRCRTAAHPACGACCRCRWRRRRPPCCRRSRSRSDRCTMQRREEFKRWRKEAAAGQTSVLTLALWSEATHSPPRRTERSAPSARRGSCFCGCVRRTPPSSHPAAKHSGKTSQRRNFASVLRRKTSTKSSRITWRENRVII